MSLKIKFLKQIFPPLILSVLITASISTILIIEYHYAMISQTKDSILQTEIADMDCFATNIATHFEENIKAILNDMEMILNVAESIKDDKTLIYDDNTTNYYISAFSIATNEINIKNSSAFDKTRGWNDDYAMWYIPGNLNLSENLNNSQGNYDFFARMDMFLRSIFFSSVNYNLVYGFFEDSGLQYKFPSYVSMAVVEFHNNDTCEYTNSGLTEYFDMRCRAYGKDIKKFLQSPNLTETIVISQPYVYVENYEIGITICGYNIKNSTNENFTIIPSKERKLNYAFCLDFEMQKLVSFQDLFALKELYFYILFHDKVFYHPYFLKNESFSEFTSITEYEFEVQDKENNEESINFNKTVLPMIEEFYEGVEFNSSIFEYQKKGVAYMATISPIFISTTGENANFAGLLMFIVEPKNLIFEKFDQTAESTANYIIIQVIIFLIIMVVLVIFVFFLINATVKSIIEPLTDLCEVVRSMTNDDLDADVTKNYTPNSEEINQLYQSFSKLKFIMKYANEEFFSGNDAKALINYSNALNLYLELNQKEGIGITYNNIGNIHLKNERYEEAANCYRMAVKMIEDDLDIIYKDNEFRQTIYIKTGTEDQRKASESKKIYLPKSRRRKLAASIDSEKISTEKLDQLNELYTNRLFQLATTLYHQAIKYDQKNKYEEIITIFKKIININSRMEGNNARIIQCLFYISNSYLETGDNVASLKYLNEAENSISLYEKVENLMKLPRNILKNLSESSEDSNLKLNIIKYQNFKEKFQGKADILKQGLMYHYGVFYKKVGKCKQAGIMFTKSIEMGKIYDPLIRKKCLENLSTLLARQNLLQKAANITNILARMDDLNHKDIVFLLDYSESMGKGARIQYAIRNFAKIFDKYITDNDKICLIRFNLNCEVVFALTHKRFNTLQLRRHLENSLNPAGKTAFYDALNVAINQFPIDNEYESKEKRRKWIVSLTDGEDNSSLMTLKNIKNKLKSSDINLIIVGMGLSKKLAKDLKDLCKYTKDGVFIESPNNDDLDVAFEAISHIIYGQNLIVESF